jgi:hypothetical protein
MQKMVTVILNIKSLKIKENAKKLKRIEDILKKQRIFT